MTIRRFEDVVAWQKGRELNKALVGVFEPNKNYSFKDQLFRASLSITNNIAEGFEHGGDKELRNFLIIARGSNAEVRSMLYTALDIGYIDRGQFEQFLNQSIEIGKLLTGFIVKLRPRQSDNKTIRQ